MERSMDLDKTATTCVLCTSTNVVQESSVGLDSDSDVVRTFVKLLCKEEIYSPLPPFIHSPDLLFCFDCTEKVSLTQIIL